MSESGWDAPETKVPPRDRESLWKETIMGGILSLFGLALIWQHMVHTGHEHTLDATIMWVGVGILSTGLFMMNRKLTKEWLLELRKFIPFLKDK
jgi:uncharacterized membrane protein YcjF (UPF0283 family)